MAAPLEACTREVQRSAIRLLGSEGVNPSEIHRRMKLQHGDACLSLQQVYDWDRKFKSEVSSVSSQTLLARAGHTQLTHQKWLQELSVCEGKTVALHWMKWSPN